MRESFQARENEMDSQKTEREKKKKKGERGEARLSGLMTLRRPDESTPAECY